MKRNRVSTLTKFAVLLLAACAAAQPKPAKERQPTDAEKMGVSGSRSMRKELDDPESFRVSSVRILKNKDAKMDTAYYVCVQGRAKNKTGGYVSLLGVALAFMPEAIGVAMDISEEGIGGYQLYCLDDPGVDVTDAVKAALKADREKE
ncbi:MAG: hypothetical protein WBE13_04950 [Candidatus Acidiferrum sp.]